MDSMSPGPASRRGRVFYPHPAVGAVPARLAPVPPSRGATIVRSRPVLHALCLMPRGSGTAAAPRVRDVAASASGVAWTIHRSSAHPRPRRKGPAVGRGQPRCRSTHAVFARASARMPDVEDHTPPRTFNVSDTPADT